VLRSAPLGSAARVPVPAAGGAGAGAGGRRRGRRRVAGAPLSTELFGLDEAGRGVGRGRLVTAPRDRDGILGPVRFCGMAPTNPD